LPSRALAHGFQLLHMHRNLGIAAKSKIPTSNVVALRAS
jgi:hypothetical protein